MITFSHPTKAICLIAVLSSTACAKPNVTNINEATVWQANLALGMAIGLTAIGFTVAATQLD